MTLTENFRRSKLLRKALFPVFYFSFPFPLFFSLLCLIRPYVRKLFICFRTEKSHTPIGSRNDGGSLFHDIKGVGFQFQFDRASDGGSREIASRGGCARRCNLVYEGCGYVQAERKRDRIVDR